MRLYLVDSERKWAAQELLNLGLGGRRFLVGICPGAVFGGAKRWMPERYAGLADRLIDGLGADVLIFGSRAERPLAETIAKAMMHTPILLAGDTSLRKFMALLARCHLVVANDSGPLHVAGALGLPLLALYGPTDERGSAPQGERVRVVKHEVECRPCHLSECPIDSRCMKGISVDDAYTAALQAVKSWGLQRRVPGPECDGSALCGDHDARSHRIVGNYREIPSPARPHAGRPGGGRIRLRRNLSSSRCVMCLLRFSFFRSSRETRQISP